MLNTNQNFPRYYVKSDILQRVRKCCARYHKTFRHSLKKLQSKVSETFKTVFVVFDRVSHTLEKRPELLNMLTFGVSQHSSYPTRNLCPAVIRSQTILVGANICASLILLHLLTDHRRHSVGRWQIISFKFYLLKRVRVPVVAVIMVLLVT